MQDLERELLLRGIGLAPDGSGAYDGVTGRVLLNISDAEFGMATILDHYGVMRFDGIRVGRLTNRGIDEASQIAAKLRNRKCCYNCKHLEYVQGEAWDGEGWACNHRAFTTHEAELDHLWKLTGSKYKWASKKCCEVGL